MITEITEAVQTGNLYDISDILTRHLDAGDAPVACLDAMIAGLDKTGKLFECGEYYVPELMMAADTFKAGMDVLAPHLTADTRHYLGTVVIGSVQGDVHDIGKNLVGFMLECNGFKVIDLGTNVTPARFIQAVKEYSADVLAMSALLTTTMLGMPNVVQALEQAGVKQKVKVIIGGAPISQKFCDDIHADAYSINAPQGVEIVAGWMG
jgi:5-methyltetrahydrofolate--homocysteine methyltransferase